MIQDSPDTPPRSNRLLINLTSIGLLALTIGGLSSFGFGVVPVWILAVPFILLACMDFEMRFREARSVTAQLGMIAFHFVIVATVVAAHQQIGAARDPHAGNSLASRAPGGKTSGCGSGGCGASGSCGSTCGGGGQGASGGCGGGCGSKTTDATKTKAKAQAMTAASALQGRTGIPTPRPMPTSIPAPTMASAKPPVSLVPNGLPVPVTNAGSPPAAIPIRVSATPSSTSPIAAPAGGTTPGAKPPPSPEATPPRAPSPKGPAPGPPVGGTPPTVPAPTPATPPAPQSTDSKGDAK